MDKGTKKDLRPTQRPSHGRAESAPPVAGGPSRRVRGGTGVRRRNRHACDIVPVLTATMSHRAGPARLPPAPPGPGRLSGR